MSKKISDFTLKANLNNLHIIGYDPSNGQEIRIPANKLVSSTNISGLNSAIAIHNSTNIAHLDIRIKMEDYATINYIDDFFGNINSVLDDINGSII